MDNAEEVLFDQLYLMVNWLTTFIILQSLAFCYALGKEERFSKILNNKNLLKLIIVGMAFILILSLLIMFVSFGNISDLLGNEKSNAITFSINLQLWVHVIAIVVYGIAPLALLYFTKMRKI